MTTSTQYNPNAELNARLLAIGASKTVYALVTPETGAAKARVFGDNDSQRRADYLDQFRDAWTSKQDAYHTEFFDVWHEWSKPVVDLDRKNFPFYYPTAGASEAIRHLIYQHAADCRPAKGFGMERRSLATAQIFDIAAAIPTIHYFSGEYEGYKAMAEAAFVCHQEHDRKNWRDVAAKVKPNDLFFVSAPSAIDGDVWEDLNEFLASMPEASVVVDATYVGATSGGFEKFNLNLPSVRNVVFSLSKPFGVYYDRIGGVFCREEDSGLFGNKWFKNLSSIGLGIELMKSHDVFFMNRVYAPLQATITDKVSRALEIPLVPSEVFLLATAPYFESDGDMGKYLNRAGRVRICLTPGMAAEIEF